MTTQNEQNPYAPPAASLESAGAPVESLEVAELASRWQRLGGALFDGLLQTITFVPVFFGSAFSKFAEVRAEGAASALLMYKLAGNAGIVAGVLLVALWVINWTLLTKRGQTIGKIVAGTRVVLLDGGRAPFGRAVAMRVWPVIVLGYLPGSFGSFLTVIDALFIFRKDRRCAHDLVAGTKVVRVGRD